MRKLIAVIDKNLAYFETALIVLILSVVVLMAFLQVFLRNIFSTGILWADIFLRHLVLWVGFIGASIATRENKHINIDVLTRLAPEKARAYIHLITDVVTMGVSIVLAIAGYNFLALEIEFNTILFENVPAWIFEIIIPIGFGMIAFRYLLKIIICILDISEGKTEPLPPPAPH